MVIDVDASYQADWEGYAMSTEENKRVVRRLFEEVYNRGGLSVIDDLVAENALGHDSTREEPVRGVQSYRVAAASFLDAFPDLRVSLDDLAAEGVGLRQGGRWSGTTRGRSWVSGPLATW